MLPKLMGCSVKSLNGLNHLHKAGAGHSGGKQKLVGARGKDIAIEVSPLSIFQEQRLPVTIFLIGSITFPLKIPNSCPSKKV